MLRLSNAYVRSRLGGLVVIAAAGMVLGLGVPAADAAQDASSFDPIRSFPGAFVFRLDGVESSLVVGARLRTRLAHRRLHRNLGRRFRGRKAAKARAHRRIHRRTRRAISVRRVRAAADDGARLKLKRPTWGKRGDRAATLWVLTEPAPETVAVRRPTPGSIGACDPDLAHLAAVGCRVLFEDGGSRPDADELWGSIDCESPGRVARPSVGGDSYPSASGEAPTNTSFRRTTVIDGDDVWGERCELGRNFHGYRSNAGPTVLYHEGQRRITFTSIRLPANFPLRDDGWQVVMQMKQTQPSANGGGTPVLALHAYAGRWRLEQSASVGHSGATRELWSAPARAGHWTRFAFDVTYSQDAAVGRISIHADLNGDGSADGVGEQSGVIRTYTLKRELPGESDDGIPAGASIPSHLRSGIYHDPALSCPPPVGCAVEFDNVQVVEAAPEGTP